MLEKEQNNLSGNCYEKFPEYYDLLYKRYFKSIPIYIQLVEFNATKESKILEIAAGTGEVTIPLLEKGYDVTSLDLNSGMLARLEKKAEEKGVTPKTILKNMNELDFEDEFDLIYMRQSVNYFIGIEELTAGFKKIKKALKQGGKFIFNSPNYEPGIKNYQSVSNIYDENGVNAFVLETNDLEDRLLIHRQDSIIWSDNEAPVYVNDVNEFYMYTKDEYERCLLEAGFGKVFFLGKNLEEHRESDKSLYGVATYE